MGVKKPDFTKLETSVNPLSSDLEIKTNSFKTNNQLLGEISEGVILPTGTIVRPNLLEAQEYTKVYHDTWYRKLITNLSPRGLQLWSYIIYDIERNKDYYWVNTKYIQNELKYRTIRELNKVIEDQLIRYALLAHSGIADTYWINPKMIFNGSRIKKYPDKLLIRES